MPDTHLKVHSDINFFFHKKLLELIKYSKLETNAHGLILYINNISYGMLPIVSAYKTVNLGRAIVSVSSDGAHSFNTCSLCTWWVLDTALPPETQQGTEQINISSSRGLYNLIFTYNLPLELKLHENMDIFSPDHNCIPCLEQCL